MPDSCTSFCASLICTTSLEAASVTAPNLTLGDEDFKGTWLVSNIKWVARKAHPNQYMPNFFVRQNGSKQNGTTKLAFLLLLTGLPWWLEDFRVSLFLMSFICAPIALTKVFICSSVNRRNASPSTSFSTWQVLKDSVTRYQQIKHWGDKI